MSRPQRNHLSPARAGLEVRPRALHVSHDSRENVRRDSVTGRVAHAAIVLTAEQVRGEKLRMLVPLVFRAFGYILRHLFDCVVPHFSLDGHTNARQMQAFQVAK